MATAITGKGTNTRKPQPALNALPKHNVMIRSPDIEDINRGIKLRFTTDVPNVTGVWQEIITFQQQ